MASVQQIQQQQIQLQQQFQTLTLSTPAPSLPTAMSSNALTTMAARPYFPDDDRLYLQLLALALPRMMEDEHQALLQQCYNQLRNRAISAQ